MDSANLYLAASLPFAAAGMQPPRVPGDCTVADSSRHTPNEGSNNINGGVTIDLTRLNDVIPSSDRQTVAVGPGNRWQDVYSVLDPQGLTVLGGRSRTVGVGGLLLSGELVNLDSTWLES
jgi:hypothetical protein